MRNRVAVTLLAAALAGLAVAVAVSAQKGTPAATAKHSFFAALAGKNEKPKGDNDGRGAFSAIFPQGQICYGYSVRDIGDPVGAHIHKGPAGKNGPIVVTLDTPNSGNAGSVSDCFDIPPDVRKDILRRPAGYYVNVHTEEFPGGAVRGQLFAKSP